MAVASIKIERFSVISSKPFDSVVAALKASVGQPNMVEFAKAMRSADSFAELELSVSAALGKNGLRVHIPVAATYALSSIKEAVAHALRGGKTLLDVAGSSY
jgi:hypothetical protein